MTPEGKPFRGLWAVALLLGFGLVACGPSVQPPAGSYDKLVPLAPQLLTPGAWFQTRVVDGGGGLVPVLTVVDGSLPRGLTLSPNGDLEGTPVTDGEWQRFTLSAATSEGEPLGTQTYTLAVSVSTTSLPSSPTVDQTGDVLSFSGDWGRPLAEAFAFDPVWNLLWPLRAGAGMNGEALSSASGALLLVASGPNAGGVFDIVQRPSDPRIGVVAQLTWTGDADLDLRLLVDPALGGSEVSAANGPFEADGAWQAKIEGGSTSAPGPEVAVLAKKSPAGRYALMVTKAGGTEVKVPAFLALRRADGTVLAESRFDLFLSDDAGATIADDVTNDVQSFGCLGLVTVGPDGEVSYATAASASAPFAPAPEGE